MNPHCHELKIRPEYFSAVKSRIKQFELRKDDRGFKVGDILTLREWDEKGYTGNEVRCEIKYMLKGHDGLDEDYVILGISLLN